MLVSTDLPPKYEDLGIGQVNYGATGDMDKDLPGYSDCVVDWSHHGHEDVADLNKHEHGDAGENVRPGRF